MKWFAILLSLYTLLLSVRPCDHEHNFSDHVSSQDAHGQHDEESQCSPFCVCACASSIALVTVINFQIELKEFILKKSVSHFAQQMLGDFMPSFWQPPKI